MTPLTRRRLSDKLVAIATSLEALADDAITLDQHLAAHLMAEADRLRDWSGKLDRKGFLDPLPRGQAATLACIRSHIEQHGRPPTRAEIGEALGHKSANAAQEHLMALERKGVIAIDRSTSRGLRVLRP